MVSHYSTDLQVTVMHQETLQCTTKGSEEEDCLHVHMDVNNAGFKMFQKISSANVLRNYFRREMHSALSLDHKDIHTMFGE